MLDSNKASPAGIRGDHVGNAQQERGFPAPRWQQTYWGGGTPIATQQWGRALPTREAWASTPTWWWWDSTLLPPLGIRGGLLRQELNESQSLITWDSDVQVLFQNHSSYQELGNLNWEKVTQQTQAPKWQRFGIIWKGFQSSHHLNMLQTIIMN